MNVGTKSLLFGAHCFFLHPWFVALGWWRLYGFPLDPRLWIAFVIHDWGYWGKPNMDGDEGETHPLWAAELMGRWFGPEWFNLCLFHSRFWVKRVNEGSTGHLRDQDVTPSRLCAADKLATSLTPWWLYLPGAILSGEVAEYRAGLTDGGKYEIDQRPLDNQARGFMNDLRWFWACGSHMANWAWEHRDEVSP